MSSLFLDLLLFRRRVVQPTTRRLPDFSEVAAGNHYGIGGSDQPIQNGQGVQVQKTLSSVTEQKPKTPQSASQ